MEKFSGNIGYWVVGQGSHAIFWPVMLLPMAYATATQASDGDVVMGFQGNGSMLAIQCMADSLIISPLGVMEIEHE